MPVDVWLYFILGFMIVGSIACLEIKDILSSIITIGVVGLSLSLAFLALQAPDLALVQFVFEILCVIILIRAFAKRGIHVPAHKRDIPETIVAAIVLISIFALSIIAFRELPSFGQPIMRVAERYLAQGGSETGSQNLVTAVILNYRIYDTIGEATVLFTAVLGTLTVIRRIGRKKRHGE
ncbi:MAG: hydrogenase subunit MbhD domain-containing protein [Candidatus Cloacimonadia bacterium]